MNQKIKPDFHKSRLNKIPKAGNLSLLSKKYLLQIILISLLVLPSCKGCRQGGNDLPVAEECFDDKPATALIKVNNAVFSLPSPYQLVQLIHKTGISYNKNLLNPVSNHTRYDDSFHKAVNMGIYGADLAYINIYGQTPDAITYFSVIKLLAQDLQLESAFDKSLADRVEKNITNYDSLMHIIATSYRNADTYLKENQREEIGVYMLTGGWIEGLYLASEISKNSQNKELITRIGEHKKPLKNLLRMLEPYLEKSAQLKKFYEQLTVLDQVFDEVGYQYHYKQSVTNADKKFTRIDCSSEIIISPAQLKEINAKINILRNQLILQNSI